MPQCPHCGIEQEQGGRCKRCGGRIGAPVLETHTAESAITLKGEGVILTFGLAPRVFAEGDGVPWTSLASDGCFLYGLSEDDWEIVVPVPCSESHDVRAFARLELSTVQGDTVDDAYTACLETEPPGNADISVFVPPDEAWEAGDARALCYFDFPDGRKG